MLGGASKLVYGLRVSQSGVPDFSSKTNLINSPLTTDTDFVAQDDGWIWAYATDKCERLILQTNVDFAFSYNNRGQSLSIYSAIPVTKGQVCLIRITSGEVSKVIFLRSQFK